MELQEEKISGNSFLDGARVVYSCRFDTADEAHNSHEFIEKLQKKSCNGFFVEPVKKIDGKFVFEVTHHIEELLEKKQ